MALSLQEVFVGRKSASSVVGSLTILRYAHFCNTQEIVVIRVYS
jgi:hypothetical protein